jgi:hypothetical protein
MTATEPASRRTENAGAVDSDSAEATAYHEAGHAVAALLLGRRFKYASIIPNPDDATLSHVRFYGLPKAIDPELGLSPKMRIRFENDIIIDLAGSEAQHRYSGFPRDEGWLDDGGDQDRHYAVDRAECIAGFDTRALEAYLNWLSIVTENLIAEPHNLEMV